MQYNKGEAGNKRGRRVRSVKVKRTETKKEGFVGNGEGDPLKHGKHALCLQEVSIFLLHSDIITAALSQVRKLQLHIIAHAAEMEFKALLCTTSDPLPNSVSSIVQL